MALERLVAWLDLQPPDAGMPLENVTLGPVVPDPGAIYTVGLNYDGPGASPRPEQPAHLRQGRRVRRRARRRAHLGPERDR